MSDWGDLPGETPIDVSGLKRKGIRTRAELNQAEAENIRKAVVKYLAAKPSRRSAPFTLSWSRRLHKQMFGDVWKGPVSFGTRTSNLGCDWHQVPTKLQTLLDDLGFWERVRSLFWSRPCGSITERSRFTRTSTATVAGPG